MSLPVAFVMEQTLGSITHYLNLRREETVVPALAPRWLPIEYRPSRLPWTVEGGLLARRAIRKALPEVAGVFVHTTTIALLAADLYRKRPTILSSDGTPANKRFMRGAYGLQPETGLASRAKRSLHAAMLRTARGIVAWSHWTKASFVEDYGCRADDVAVIPPGVRLDEFAPGDRAHELPRILFVGGDFERKGGSLLLDVFRKRLRGKAELVLVTKAKLPAEPGVSVHNDVSANSPKLRELYATSDLFALPTYADCFPLVCLEALASGLPLVGTRVGGLPDAIREGVTGHLVEPGDGQALGDALEGLAADRTRRERMASACREEAGRSFDARDTARRLYEFVRQRCSD